MNPSISPLDRTPSLVSKEIVVFDIEIENVFDLVPGEDLDKYAPFDISVAAAIDASGGIRYWHARDASGQPTGHLTRELAGDVLQHLRSEQQRGACVCAWNGMSFDVRWLGHVAQDEKLAVEVALDLFDPMFQFVGQRGFPIGLAATAAGLGIPEKKLMAAAEAPNEWARGNHQVVLDYVAGDCRLTKTVVEKILARGSVSWRTKKGTVSSEPFLSLKRVRDVMRGPPPDTTWMSDPRPWESWFCWLAPHAAKA